MDAITLIRELANHAAAEREEYYRLHDVPADIREHVEAVIAHDEVPQPVAEHHSSGAVKTVPTSPHSGPPIVPMANSQLATIGRHEVMRLLERGGMGEVYLARDPVLDRELAVTVRPSASKDIVNREVTARSTPAAALISSCRSTPGKAPWLENVQPAFTCGDTGPR
jgi:hypothetical protein